MRGGAGRYSWQREASSHGVYINTTPAGAVPLNMRVGIRILMPNCRELPQQAPSQTMQRYLVEK